MRKSNQSGRSMVEMLAVLAIIGILSLAGIYGFKKASISSQTQTMTKDISNAVTERRYQNAQNGGIKPHKLDMKVGSTPMVIENVTEEGYKAGNYQKEDVGTFVVKLKDKTKDFCESLKSYTMFKYKKLLVNGAEMTATTNIPCLEKGNEVDFYFEQIDNGSSDGGALSSPCDGVRCKTCEKCDDGKCVVDKNKIGKTFGCGQCQSDGSLKKDSSKENSCTTCDETDWSLDFKSKGTHCGKCCECDGSGGMLQTTICGSECCTNGCNSTGDGCLKECKPECNACQNCNTDTGMCEYKNPLEKTACGSVCCKSTEECVSGKCQEYSCPSEYQETTCSENQTLNDTQTLANGKTCYKCVDITECPAEYTEGVCSDGLETLKTLTLNNGKTCVQCSCSIAATCAEGGTIPKGTVFDSNSMVRGENCTCNCKEPMAWTNQNQCCIPIERVDGTSDCKSFDFKNSYNITASRARPYDKLEYGGTYKQDHYLCLKVEGVDDDLVVKVGSTTYGPFWTGCAGVDANGRNNRKLDKKYFIPANTPFELYIRDICATNVGIRYSINFCD